MKKNERDGNRKDNYGMKKKSENGQGKNDWVMKEIN